MDTSIIIVVAAAAIGLFVIVGGAIAVGVAMRRRNGDLENRYGAEYEREIKLRGRRKAEAELSQREERVARYSLRSLDPEERSAFSARWTAVQSEFVDAPRTSLQHADLLLLDVMIARGYPVADFDQRAADLSVEFGEVVRNYRAAQSIAQRGSTASTEDLRRAMLMQRKMFEALLKVEEPVLEQSAEPDEPERVLEEAAV